MAVLGGDDKRVLENLAKAYANISVAENYNVAFAVAGRYYRITSPNGTLKFERVSGNEVMPEKGNWSRYLVDSVETVQKMNKAGEDMDQIQQLQFSKRIMVIGDMEHWENFQKELKPHSRALQMALGPTDNDTDLPEINEHLKPLVAEKSRAHSEAFRVIPSQAGPIIQYGNCAEKHGLGTADESRFVLFSAGSTMSGNVGQSNYTAANNCLDAQSMFTRLYQPQRAAVTLMWGAVGGLGMRWKAFASDDALIKAGGAGLLTMKDAQIVIKCATALPEPCEWFMGAYFGAATSGSGFEQVPTEVLATSSSSGNNGIFEEDLPIDKLLMDMEFEMETIAPAYSAALHSDLLDAEVEAEILYEGARVRLVGWQKRSEMNGVTGTVIRQLADGKWKVNLDGNNGTMSLLDFHLRLESSLDSLDSGADVHDASPVEAPARQEQAVVAPAPAPQSSEGFPKYSISGTWDEFVPHEMILDSESNSLYFIVRLGSKNRESFRLLLDGDVKQCLYPSTNDACPHSEHDVCGPVPKYKCRGNSWTIGQHQNDEAAEGACYKVQLVLNSNRQPERVDWTRLGGDR